MPSTGLRIPRRCQPPIPSTIRILPWNVSLTAHAGHRRQGPLARSPRQHRRQAAPQRPEDRCCAMRGPQHLRRVLPRQVYVHPPNERARQGASPGVQLRVWGYKETMWSTICTVLALWLSALGICFLERWQLTGLYSEVLCFPAQADPLQPHSRWYVFLSMHCAFAVKTRMRDLPRHVC